MVDDDDSIRTALRRLLETAGFSVETFGSAESFLESPAADHTDCLVLDLRLEGASGLELQQELLAAERHVPTVFISSHRDTGSKQAAMHAGAIDFLYKPVDADILLDAIQRALEDM